MNEEDLRFVDDKVFAYTPLPQYGDGICKVQLVMTKEIFQECYKRWIKPQEDKRLNVLEETMNRLFNDLIKTRDMLLNHVITLDQRIKELSNEDKKEDKND